jgi:hypothetical protein
MIKEVFPDSGTDTPPRAHSPPPVTSEEVNQPGSSMYAVCTPSKPPLKARSLSDSTPRLAPSPKLKERKPSTQDDHSVPLIPNTPRRADPPLGLHLHVPRREINFTSPVLSARSPLSPKLDNRSPYTSPVSVLPRHSRGMDFARAVTNLHHSTRAEQSSPDSSPALAQRAMMNPHRKQSVNSMSVDPPFFTSGNERSTLSSSVGSINMLGSEDSSSDDDLEPMDPDEHEDPILATPKIHRKSPSFSLGTTTPANLWPNLFPQGGGNFTGFRKGRLREARSRNSSSSASGNSNVASPVPMSPNCLKGTDTNYFSKDGAFRRPASRRESISKGTNELHISSGNDSGDEAGFPGLSTPSVIRRPVSRRGNMLVSRIGKYMFSKANDPSQKLVRLEEYEQN